MPKELIINVATGETIEADLSPEDLAALLETNEQKLERQRNETEQLRRNAYIVEADPLFFGWQRGENTEQEWLDKVAEIRARHPYS